MTQGPIFRSLTRQREILIALASSQHDPQEDQPNPHENTDRNVMRHADDLS
jgi:hypothetical protein